MGRWYLYYRNLYTCIYIYIIHNISIYYIDLHLPMNVAIVGVNNPYMGDLGMLGILTIDPQISGTSTWLLCCITDLPSFMLAKVTSLVIQVSHGRCNTLELLVRCLVNVKHLLPNRWFNYGDLHHGRKCKKKRLKQIPDICKCISYWKRGISIAMKDHPSVRTKWWFNPALPSQHKKKHCSDPHPSKQVVLGHTETGDHDDQGLEDPITRQNATTWMSHWQRITDSEMFQDYRFRAEKVTSRLEQWNSA